MSEGSAFVLLELLIFLILNLWLFFFFAGCSATAGARRPASLHQVATSTATQDGEQGRKERQTWQQAGEEPEQRYVWDAR